MGGWFVGWADATNGLQLVTSTFDPDRLGGNRSRPLDARSHDRAGHRLALDSMAWWYGLLRERAPQADVLAGVELHKSGARHWHALVGGLPDGFRWKDVWAEWYARYGAQRWDEVRAPEAAGRYAAKYTVKELGEWRVARHGGRLG
jgi:hypothetical protein